MRATGIRSAAPFGRVLTAKQLLMCGLASVSVGAATAVSAQISLGMVLFIVLAYVVAASALSRAALIIFGGILVLQSTSGLSAAKLLYLAVVAISVIVIVAEAKPLPAKWHAAHRRGTLVLFVAALSVLNAIAYGVFITDWLRDVSPYLLLGVAVLVGHDLSYLGVTRLRRLVVIVGAIGTVSFLVAWLSRRGVSGVSQLAFSSFLLVVGFFCYAIAGSLLGARKWAWRVGAIVAAIALLLTGARSAVLLALVPLLVGGFAKGTSLSRRATHVGTMLAVAVVILAIGLTAGIQVGPIQVSARLRSSAAAIFGGNDNSIQTRKIVTRLAWETFKDAPIFGQGPGHKFQYYDPYPSARPSDRFVSVVTADSGLATAAKLGLVGVAALVWYVVGIATAARPTEGAARSMGSVATLAFASFLIPWSVFSSPIDDKGLSFILLLLVALAIAEAREAPSLEDPPRERALADPGGRRTLHSRGGQDSTLTTGSNRLRSGEEGVELEE